jgi:excisionase family DNA binding protein
VQTDTTVSHGAPRRCGSTRIRIHFDGVVHAARTLEGYLLSELLTVDQLAESLNTSISTVRYWRTIGYGPRSARIGRRVLYRRADVDAWLDEQFAVVGEGGAA